MADAALVQAAVELAVGRWGRLDGLVCCAGVAPGGKVAGKEGPHRLESFARVLQVNLAGTFNCVRLAAQAMQAQEPDAEAERGVIVCAGRSGIAYAASKAASYA
jgi:NAD(P)-dependent dehydrogenase (short-subunit alcohol dehydrogenase family)